VVIFVHVKNSTSGGFGCKLGLHKKNKELINESIKLIVQLGKKFVFVLIVLKRQTQTQTRIFELIVIIIIIIKK